MLDGNGAISSGVGRASERDTDAVPLRRGPRPSRRQSGRSRLRGADARMPKRLKVGWMSDGNHAIVGDEPLAAPNDAASRCRASRISRSSPRPVQGRSRSPRGTAKHPRSSGGTGVAARGRSARTIQGPTAASTRVPAWPCRRRSPGRRRSQRCGSRRARRANRPPSSPTWASRCPGQDVWSHGLGFFRPWPWNRPDPFRTRTVALPRPPHPARSLEPSATA